jgi:hypothetical protein
VDMKDFVDLKGASGSEYRFRVWTEGAHHLPVAGNYAYVRWDEDGVKVLQLGETNDLSKARDEWPKAAKRGATHVYTRLNVSRLPRLTEHQDLVAHYKTARVSEPVA